ncbi:methanogen output domain 1-containing protein [Kaarinaea lacus]
MPKSQVAIKEIKDLNIPLERDGFLRNLIREQSGLLEDMVGLEETSGFISVVGQNIGSQINQLYRRELKLPKLNREQVSEVLADLKNRINGEFVIEEQDDTKIVFKSKVCPFAEKVKDRSSLCMMTSNVFGVIAADNLGYAKVDLEKTIARGDMHCRVVVYLEPDNEQTKAASGREYFEAES